MFTSMYSYVHDKFICRFYLCKGCKAVSAFLRTLLALPGLLSAFPGLLSAFPGFLSAFPGLLSAFPEPLSAFPGPLSAFPVPQPASPLEALPTEDPTASGSFSGRSSASEAGSDAPSLLHSQPSNMTVAMQTITAEPLYALPGSAAASASEQQRQALERSAVSVQLGQHIASQQSASASEAEDAQQATALEQGTTEDVILPISAALINSLYIDGSEAGRGDIAFVSPLHQQFEEQLHQPQQQQRQHGVRHQTAVDVNNAAARCTDVAVITQPTPQLQAPSSSPEHADSAFGMPFGDSLKASQPATAAELLSNAAVTQAVEEAGAQAVAEPLQKSNSGLWRDCNSPVSSMASGHMSLAEADDINTADFEDLDMSHSMQGSSSLQSSSSSLDAAAVGWEPMHQSRSHSPGLLVIHTQQQTSEREVDKVTAVSELSEQGGAFLVQSSTLMPQSAELTIQGSSAAALINSPAASVLPQVSQQSALLQQGMAAATAQLLLMGAQWGSNLGSLCNLGLMLSPSGFILLSPKYEIVEIIGEGAYGEFDVQVICCFCIIRAAFCFCWIALESTAGMPRNANIRFTLLPVTSAVSVCIQLKKPAS